MQPTEILTDEHRVIEQVLAVLEKMANLAEHERRFDEPPAREAVDFFRNFADRRHHAKEEEQLFPLLESRGFSAEQGPTAVMRQEHVQGRDLLRRLDEAISAAGDGQEAGLRAFVDTSREYVDLLRAHIEKEDHCLFPMARQALTETDQTELQRRFDRADGEPADPRTHDDWVNIAGGLADRFGVPRATLKRGCCAST